MKRRSFLATSAGLSLVSASVKQTSGNSSKAKIAETIPRLRGSAGPIVNEKLRERNQTRSTVLSQKGVVATSQSLASSVGLDILKKGGNAIDAAIAANAMLSVVEPMSCGPGGDLFAIIWIESEKRLYGLNASGRSPYAWSRDEAAKRGFTESLPIYGPLAWSVPGCVSGWNALHSRFGKRSWSDILSPAEETARSGFPVTEIIASGWQGAVDGFKDYPNAAKTFLVDGKAPQFGQVFRNPDMANFLKTIIRDGADAFYQGEIAERIAAYSKERGGVLRLEDLQQHTVSWTEPVSASYRGYDVWELPPNGQGIAALQMLTMLEQFDIGSMKPNSAEHLHLLIEAKKLAFEDRAFYYADMDKSDVPLKQLISKEYGKERAKLIDPLRASVSIKPGVLDGSKDTIYLTTSDSQGNMVSLIQSTFYGWGSREVPTGLGFCLQNRGRSFSLDPNRINTLEPHKRPFHTIIPGFLTKDGHPQCSFGVMGGDFQPQGHAQVLMNMIDYGMSPQQAGEQPRVAHEGSSEPWEAMKGEGGTVQIEQGIDPETIQQLEKLGHSIGSVGTRRFGGYQAIWREDDPMRYFAGSDPRKDGCAMAY